MHTKGDAVEWTLASCFRTKANSGLTWTARCCVFEMLWLRQVRVVRRATFSSLTTHPHISITSSIVKTVAKSPFPGAYAMQKATWMQSSKSVVVHKHHLGKEENDQCEGCVAQADSSSSDAKILSLTAKTVYHPVPTNYAI